MELNSPFSELPGDAPITDVLAERKKVTRVLIVGSVTALACVATWVGISYLVTVKIGFTAAVIGVLIGLSIRFSARGGNDKFGFIAVAVCGVGWIISTVSMLPLWGFDPMDLVFGMIMLLGGYLSAALGKSSQRRGFAKDPLDELIEQKRAAAQDHKKPENDALSTSGRDRDDDDSDEDNEDENLPPSARVTRQSAVDRYSL